MVLKESEELRQYYEERNRDLIARLSVKPPKPGMEGCLGKVASTESKTPSPT